MANLYEVILSFSAQKDIIEIIKYYDEIKAGLSDDFLINFESILEFLNTHPHIYKKVYHDFHQAFMNTFQYAIFYKIIETKKLVEVIGVFHTSRDSDIWVRFNYSLTVLDFVLSSRLVRVVTASNQILLHRYAEPEPVWLYSNHI